MSQMAKPRRWMLRFDGTAFCLESDFGPTQAPVRNRVIEEGLETILFHWGNELLPAPRLHMLACSGAITKEQDLLAVDELGRIHIFELKNRHSVAERFQFSPHCRQIEVESRVLFAGIAVQYRDVHNTLYSVLLPNAMMNRKATHAGLCVLQSLNGRGGRI